MRMPSVFKRSTTEFNLLSVRREINLAIIHHSPSTARPGNVSYRETFRPEEPSLMSDADWSAARAAMMLDPTIANLNTGSFGPLPRIVFERVTELRRRLAEEPMDFLVRWAPLAVGGPRAAGAVPGR